MRRLSSLGQRFRVESLVLLWLLCMVPLVFGLSTTGSMTMTTTTPNAKGPVLVVGATGKVGRRVVQKLLASNRPVRALVRNKQKAQSVLGTSDELPYPPLEIVECDLGTATLDDLSPHVEGCSAIVSVSGALRFSRWTDFVPWRLLSPKANWSKDVTTHPYYLNSVAQTKLIDLASTHRIPRFVRLTGLSCGLSPFSPVSILFNTLLSLTTKWHLQTEDYLRASNVPYVILRPGGLADSERDTSTTNLQVDPSGVLPAPARVGRSDVAALAIAACDLLGPQESFTLAVRWVGDNIQPKSQGKMEDGCATAQECIQQLSQVADAAAAAVPPQANNKNKPYGLATGLFVYTFAAIMLRLMKFTILFGSRIFRRF